MALVFSRQSYQGCLAYILSAGITIEKRYSRKMRGEIDA